MEVLSMETDMTCSVGRVPASHSGVGSSKFPRRVVYYMK